MLLWPKKTLEIETRLDKDSIYQIIDQSTDQDYKSIYWGKRFYKTYWGTVSPESFKIRPVVPYWNISPLEIRATVKSITSERTRVSLKMVCPFMRIIGPLAVLAILLFFISFGLQDEMNIFLKNSLLILFGGYILVNLPFQIQASRNVGDLLKKLEGEILQAL
jgi:hypothetical protein